MFDGFRLETIGVPEATLRVRHGRQGPPVLLHGHPRTHATWHRVAPLLADPDAWYGGSPEAMGVGNYEDFRAAIHDPATVHGMIEDYRAGLGIDREHDAADRRAGIKLRCPVLALWSLRSDLQDLYGDVLDVWRPWAPDVCGHGILSGHHMAEEAPEALAAALREFLAG